MKNPDNKTKIVENFDLKNYVNLIENNPCHIATVRKNNTPNLAVAADIRVLDKNTILIAHNEMENTPENLLSNKNVVITSFNDSWAGLRLSGKAEYFTQGEYMDICNQLFKSEKNTPKGAIVIKVDTAESLA